MAILFTDTPFTDMSSAYPVMGYVDAARQYAIFSNTEKYSAQKTFTLHQDGKSQSTTVAFQSSIDRHILLLKNAYVLSGIGVFTEHGFFLPAEYTSAFPLSRVTVSENTLSFSAAFWEKLSQRSVKRVKIPLFHADSSHAGHGHFLLEALPRCWALNALPKKNITVSALRAPKTELFRHCLPALGYQADTVKKLGAITLCKTLYLASMPVFLRRYVYPEARQVWERIGQFFKNYKKVSRPYKVYISRSNIERRTLRNQQELENIFKKYGFIIYHPEKASFPEQVHIFANASHIACPYGSGIFNALFGQMETSILTFASDSNYFKHFPYYDDRFQIDALLDNSNITKEHDSPNFNPWELGNLDYCRHVVDEWVRRTKA